MPAVGLALLVDMVMIGMPATIGMRMNVLRRNNPVLVSVVVAVLVSMVVIVHVAVIVAVLMIVIVAAALFEAGPGLAGRDPKGDSASDGQGREDDAAI